ncbi:MAG: hypothetical protein ACLT38_06635 [Akkermansia sp.]
MKAFTFPALVLAALSIWTAAAQTRISTIPPLPGKNARSLQVPPYQSFCWFAADRGRWPGDGNRVLPWFGRTAPGNLLDSKPNPSTAKPGTMPCSPCSTSKTAISWPCSRRRP